MTPGQLVRRMVGDRWFSVMGRYYRAVFVDIDKVVNSLPAPPPGASILDVGGGDGAIIDGYLAKFPDARVTMIDLSPRIGTMLRPGVRERVELLPATSMEQYRALGRKPPDLIMVSDVVHHVPEVGRRQFFAEVGALLAGRPSTLVVKDVQPGTLRALAALAADRYISGDRATKFMSEQQMIALVEATIPCTQHVETPLLREDSPNYCVIFTTAGAGASAA